MEEITETSEETPEAKPWGIWPNRQTLVDQDLLGRRNKRRSGITTTPRPMRQEKARLKAKAAAKARKRQRG